MAIVADYRYEPLDDPDDPDDYRPNSEFTIVFDPAIPSGDFVHDLVLLFEKLAAGDRIPLHTHPAEEVIVIDEGSAEVTLGDERRVVEAGAVIFIPVGTPHGLRNATDKPVRLHGIFPSSVIDVRYLDRNPAPGTEGQPPSHLIIDVREQPT
jgi:quercetin dioxygenase-like cupin family protein